MYIYEFFIGWMSSLWEQYIHKQESGRKSKAFN